MDEVLASGDEPGTAVGLRLAEAWADFTKALAIYPETNDRVRLNLEKFQAALQETAVRSSGSAGLSLLFRDGELVAGSERHDIENRSSIGWLRARLDHAGLAGVQFRPGLDDSTLVSFSQRLLANFLQKGRRPEFKEMWPETYHGLDLLDRRFEGIFSESGAGPGLGAAASGGGSSGGEGELGDKGSGGHGDKGPGHGGDGPGGPGRVAGVGGSAAQEEVGSVEQEGHYQPENGLPLKSNAFLAGLMSEADVAERLERLHDLINTQPAEGTRPSHRATDLLQQVIEGLSAESVKDRPTLVRSLCTAFDEILRPHSAELEGAQQDFAKLLKGVSESHFAREGAAIERLQAQRAVGQAAASTGGRKGDEAIDDDVETLLKEFAQLPARLEINLDRRGAASRGEITAVLLYYLVNLEKPEAVLGLYPPLRDLLERPEPEVLAVLKRHLKEATVPGKDGERAAAALVRLLVRVGQPELLRDSGLLAPERVIASFPKHFGAYLASLKIAKPAHMNELNWVCERIGHGRVLDAAQALRPELEQLDTGTAAALLDRPDAARLPLARLLLEIRRDVSAEQGAAFLRTLDLPDPGAFLLYEMPDGQLLTPDYLMNLMDHHMGRVSTGRLSESVADVLCQHIRETRKNGRTSRARLASIRNLLRFPAPAGWKMLKELSKTRWAFFGAGEPFAVRRLAKSISKHYKTA